MFRRIVALALCGTACLSAASLWSYADDPKPGAPTQEQMEAMMKAWQEFATPGEEHKRMAELVGEWTCKVDDFSSGQPMTSDGSAKFSMLFEGRYLMHEFEGNMAGMPFKGMGLTAYNNESKKFQEVWLDSVGTGIYFAQGERIDDQTIETRGVMTMPGAGEMNARSLTKHTDKDHMTFEMYMPGPDGKEMLGVRITYTRKS